ncbi:histidine kinase [Daejeonella sp.]|uniref:sensor histidine kinase n=1 Tax=Daejeonella sp. TaxID=2805397 RepID=UPI0030C17D23
MRDLIFNLTRKNNPPVYYHILFWGLFMVYEITLAAAIRERFNHFADYSLHYLLNIFLFYFHCFFVIGKRQYYSIADYRYVAGLLALELICYYLGTVSINKVLTSAGISVSVPDTSSKLFHLSLLYRCLYIIGLSTGFRIALNLLDSRDRIHKFITQNLIAEKEKATLRTELLSAELSFLRSQINPHFLLNSLNSVYNRIRKNDPNSAEYVMALADLMQYALQPPTATDEVPIESELDHISNYLKLQRMRYSAEMEVKISNDEPDLKIAPLLLITLIENVFQHGELNNPKSAPKIEIMISLGELMLQTRNQIRSDHRPGNGVGLPNTQKRLELQYKDRYSLNYGAEKNIFNVKLTIQLR